MYVLLLICNALCPQPLDESLEKPIREKHAGGVDWGEDDKQQRWGWKNATEKIDICIDFKNMIDYKYVYWICHMSGMRLKLSIIFWGDIGMYFGALLGFNGL